MPGEDQEVELVRGNRKFKDLGTWGKDYSQLLKGKNVKVAFPGTPLKEKYHRKLGDLKECKVPGDAEALYEATCFSADNNALEVRELERSGPTKIPAVKKARDAFLNQPLFIDRGLWDKNMFDGDNETTFYIARRHGAEPMSGGALRVDFGEVIDIDKLVIRCGSEYALARMKYDETVVAYVSSDLKDWKQIKSKSDKEIVVDLGGTDKIRYIRFRGTPELIREIEGYHNGEMLDRSKWRGSQLFAQYRRVRAKKAWEHSFTLNEIPKGSYLAIALKGQHGVEGAYAAIRVDGKPVGAPKRAISYPCNAFENPPRKRDSNYTYYVPLTEDMIGKKIDAVVLLTRYGVANFEPEVWVTAYPTPYRQKIITLSE